MRFVPHSGSLARNGKDFFRAENAESAEKQQKRGSAIYFISVPFAVPFVKINYS
jgi:hypothetical protein